MDRAEQTGLGVAVIGHLALFGALSLGLLSAPKLPKLDSQPVEVTLSSEVDLKSAAPAPAPPSPEPPAPAPSAQAAPPEPAPTPVVAAPPPPPIEKPQPKVVPKPELAPKPSPKAEAKPKPDKSKPEQKAATKPVKVAVATPDPTARRRPGLSNSIVSGLADTPTPSKTTKPARVAAPATVAAPTGISAAQITGAQKSSLNALLYSQLKPHWKPPSGADAELLVTKLSVHLNKDGSLSGDPEVIGQAGINDSNRAQAKLHAERAIQAVRRAAPFNLPQDYYEAWKWLKPLKLYVGQPG